MRLARFALLAAFILMSVPGESSWSQTASSASFSSPRKIPLVSSGSNAASAFAPGDMTHNSKADFVVSLINPIKDAGGHATYLEYLKGSGTGLFTRSAISGETNSDSVVLIHDLNSDHNPDIVTVYPGSYDPRDGSIIPGTVDTFLGDGKRNFRLTERLYIGEDLAYAVIGDFNKDGKPDIAVLSNFMENDESTLYIFLNHGNGTFTHGATYNFYGDGENLIVGDFDGDGKLDLAFDDSQNFNSGVLYFFKGQGNGTFKQTSSYTLSSFVTSLAAADLNRDGKTDIVAGLQAASTKGARPLVTTLFFNGKSFFVHSSTVTPDSLVWLSIGDLNKDTKLDLSATDGTTGKVYTLMGDGKGGFAAPQTLTGYAPADQIVATPLVSGGKLDLVFGFTPFASPAPAYLGLILNQ